MEGSCSGRAQARTGLGGRADRQVQLLPAPLAAQLHEATRARQLLQESVHIGHIHKYSAVTGEWLLKVGPVRKKKKNHRTPHSDLCPKGQSCLANIKHLEQQWKQQSKAAQWEPREQTAGAEMTKLGAASFLFALWNVLCRCNVLYRNTWMLRKCDVEPCNQTGRWFSP